MKREPIQDYQEGKKEEKNGGESGEADSYVKRLHSMYFFLSALQE